MFPEQRYAMRSGLMTSHVYSAMRENGVISAFEDIF